VSPGPRTLLLSPDLPAPVLLVSPYPDDHFVLPELLADSNWEWHKSHGCREALDLLQTKAFTVVICERDQPDGCWRDLLDAGAKLTPPPSLIVCSRLADEHLWAEVLNLGGYDVLAKPFDHEEVSRVTFGAWHSWKRQSGQPAGPKTASGENRRSVGFISAA
jgi:DNA-binding NtrC family response regulator